MSSRIPQDFIDRLLEQTDIVELIDNYIPLRKSGTSHTARCPFHSEKTPSFHVSSVKQLYHCFGCGVGGNAIHFLMAYEKLDFVETIKRLAARAGLALPQTTSLITEPAVHASLYPLLDEVTSYFQNNLRANQKAIDYLKNRGISGQIAKTFRIGYAPDFWDKLHKTFSVKCKTEDLLNAGLIIKRETGGFYDRFRDRVMFPIHDFQGRVIAFGGRILDTGEPKYLNSPETALFQKSKEIYGLYEARKASSALDSIWVVEGYMDVVALAQAGITHAVATLGTAVTAMHIQRLFKVTQEIIFCFDADNAGRQAAWRALEVSLPFLQDGCQVRFVILPEGEDPDSYVRSIGREKFLAMPAQTMPEFFFNHLLEDVNLNLAEERAKLAKKGSEYIKQIPGQFLRQIMLDRLSHLVRIETKKLNVLANVNDVNRMKAVTNYKSISNKKPLSRRSPTRLVIMLILQYPDLVFEIELPKEVENLEIPGISILKELFRLLKNNPHLTTAMLIEYWRGKPEETAIQKLAVESHSIPEEGTKGELKGALFRLQTLGTEQKIDWLLDQGQIRALTGEEKALLQGLIQSNAKLTS